MRLSEIRERVLRDHRDLRERVGRVEALSRAALASASRAESLRDEARALIRVLEWHIHWEDEHLAPALADVDEWGPERLEHMKRDHVEQRDLIRYTASVLDDPDRALELLARTTLDLARLLQDDMRDEEGTVLDPSVLRDDVIGVDVETG
ncbi:MAG TPA: hemerythrin domain-containing protein [Myxococcota bacterium]|nr:hemerythrin domain-containing protein [Myxococcota bacterium]